MNKIVVAMDSFKGSLSARQATKICADAVRESIPGCEVIELPMADGGEGFADIVASHPALAHSFRPIDIVVEGPLYAPVTARYFYNEHTHTAIMELAQACGLTLVDEKHRNPLLTSTIGVGEMIMDAVRRGADNIIMGIGGSATNDAGTGLLSVLGFRFLDKNGYALRGCGENLEKICSIDSSNVNKKLFETSFTIACDVTNPLLGISGATHVYGPQKGADMPMVERLEAGMRNFANLVASPGAAENTSADLSENSCGLMTGDMRDEHFRCMATIPGAGAAGGVGGSLFAFLNARLHPGIDVVLDILEFDKIISDADLIITGEGSLDPQTLNGKVAMGILNHTKQSRPQNKANQNHPIITTSHNNTNHDININNTERTEIQNNSQQDIDINTTDEKERKDNNRQDNTINTSTIPVIAIGGRLSDCELLNKAGFTACFSIINTPSTLDYCLSQPVAEYNLKSTTTQIIRLCKTILSPNK